VSPWVYLSRKEYVTPGYTMVGRVIHTWVYHGGKRVIHLGYTREERMVHT